MIVVDTSVWIDYFNGVRSRETDLLHGLLGTEPIVVGDLIIAELLQGFRNEREVREVRAALDTLIFQPMVGREAALSSALNYRTLRAKGVTVRKTVGMLIATFCIERGHRLLHADRDFDAIARHLDLQTL